MSTLTHVEMSPCEYIYIRVVAETFSAVPAEINKFYLYALELHILWFKLLDELCIYTWIASCGWKNQYVIHLFSAF